MGLNGDGEGAEIHTLQVPPRITEFQHAYARKVVDTVNGLDNVLYEIGNELHTGSVECGTARFTSFAITRKPNPNSTPSG